MSGVEYLQQIVLIHIPGKDHIVEPGPDNPEYDGKDGQVQVVLLVLACPFRLHHGHTDARQHADPDHNAVVGNIKTEHGHRLSHVFQMDADIGEFN